MKTKGRPARAIDAALTYLINKMYRGVEVSVKDLEAGTHVSRNTLLRAKRTLQLESIFKNGQWYWRYPRKDNYNIPIEIAKPQGASPEPDDPDPMRMTTEDIIHLTRNWTLQGKEPEEIIAEACASGALYPQIHPYPAEYIRSVVMHELEGKPLRSDLNKNKE